MSKLLVLMYRVTHNNFWLHGNMAISLQIVFELLGQLFMSEEKTTLVLFFLFDQSYVAMYLWDVE